MTVGNKGNVLPQCKQNLAKPSSLKEKQYDVTDIDKDSDTYRIKIAEANSTPIDIHGKTRA